MREHQKTLPVAARGRSSPRFLAVADQAGDPKGLIARGNEWVINARFADARFFWDDDGKTPLEDRLSRLGSLSSRRSWATTSGRRGGSRSSSERLAARLDAADLAPAVVKAARLLKADLVTDMVREFPDLQGVVGGLYARREGEPRGGLAGALRPVPARLGRGRVAAGRRRRASSRSPTGSTR